MDPSAFPPHQILRSRPPAHDVQANEDEMSDGETGEEYYRGEGEAGDLEFETEEDIDNDVDVDVDDEMGIPPDDEYDDGYGEQSTCHGDNQEDADDQDEEPVPSFDPAAAGLKEISNLAKFTVSSYKPGNGVAELRTDDLKQYWQSDGPQPHRLTIHFIKRVGIRDIRFFVDYESDESYTPTKIVFRAGTSENNLIEFATMEMENPVGWQQVPVAGAGGGRDGNTLFAWVVQMQVLENSQNGKDTHLRGIKIFALDGDGTTAENVKGEEEDEVGCRVKPAPGPKQLEKELEIIEKELHEINWSFGDGGPGIPDFMREPELR